MESDDAGSERGHQAPMRRTFLAGLGAATGAGALGGTAEARSTASPRQAGAVYHIVRRGDGDGGVQDYRVMDGETGSVVFTTDETADVAFQFGPRRGRRRRRHGRRQRRHLPVRGARDRGRRQPS